jgi:hypothetical protein
MRPCWQVFALAVVLAATPARASDEPDTIIFATMSGTCSTLKVAGRDFACRAVAFFQTEEGRANFTVALADPDDDSHIITFSGDNGRRPQANLYELPIDRMLLKSKDRPKADGRRCRLSIDGRPLQQVGNFVTLEVSASPPQRTRTAKIRAAADGIDVVRRIKRCRQPAVSPFD